MVILDRSGSMQSAKSDHEGGLKSFVEDQQKLDGDVKFTLVQFDDQDPCEIVYDRTPIQDVKEIKLVPRGWTPLFDAIGRAVSHLRKTVSDADNAVVMIITDGDENWSKEWTKDRVKSLVTELESKGWTFLFLGANIDAFAVGGAIGASAGTTMNFANDSVGVGSTYAFTSCNLAEARASYTSALGEELERGVSNIQARAAAKGILKSKMKYTGPQRAMAMGKKPTQGGDK